MPYSLIEILKVYKIQILMVFSILALYLAFAYDLERHNFTKLITLYAALFFLSFKLIQLLKVNFKALLLLGVLIRLVFLIAIPNLSQDYFRFLWDGRLLAEGLNPYLYTPNQWLEAGNLPIKQASELVAGMGSLSAQYHSNYPPVNQFFFWLSGLISGNAILGGVIVLRCCILVADLGIAWLGSKLLTQFNLPKYQIFWYFLNPFIIIELTGNLHFEGVMLFFLLASLYLLHRGNWFWSAILLGVSISLKLLPLLMLPLFYQILIKEVPECSSVSKKWNHLLRKPLPVLWKLSRFYAVCLLVFGLSFLPFLTSELIGNFANTIALWFQKFEFNASVYYIVRWFGFQSKGYNIIATAGRVLPVLVIFGLILLAFLRKNNSTQRLLSVLLLGTTLYFLFSTTVHPWYIATPLLLSVFTRYKFALVWSGVVMLSYSAYHLDTVTENLGLVGLEYIAVISFFIWELVQNTTVKQKI